MMTTQESAGSSIRRRIRGCAGRWRICLLRIAVNLPGDLSGGEFKIDDLWANSPANEVSACPYNCLPTACLSLASVKYPNLPAKDF